MTKILWTNLNIIELLTILQLITSTIQNSSDGNNIKPQALKRLLNKEIRSFILDSRKFS